MVFVNSMSDLFHEDREQCEDAGVPFFFKQWGGVRKKAAGRTLSG
jgi:protein gp37